MNITFESIRRSIKEGSNPVEVAGFGREAVHKGYLQWALNTDHWADAPRALTALLRAAVAPEEGSAESAAAPIPSVPESLHCLHEQKVGRRKVDLKAQGRGDGGSFSVAIELKVDAPPGKNQFRDMSAGLNGSPGIVLLLGTSALRTHSWDEVDFVAFRTLTPSQILAAWERLEEEAPPPVQDWLSALRHEETRLHRVMELGRAARETTWLANGFRSPKCVWYAVLNQVRTPLSRRGLGRWSLYDGGHNSVLNLSSHDNLWHPIASVPGLEAYFEFNDGELWLKVRLRGDEAEGRGWIQSYQARALALEGLPAHLPRPEKPRRARKGSTWVGVLAWKGLTFDDLDEVADLTAQIVRTYGAPDLLK